MKNETAPNTPSLYRVLMLGWEYPPILAGGLGKACHGLARALSGRVDLTLVLPHRKPESVLPLGKVIGLNQLHFPEETSQQTLSSVSRQIRIRYVQTELFAYPGITKLMAKPLPIEEELRLSTTVTKPGPTSQLFAEESPYGPNLTHKVLEYARVVSTRIAQELDFDLVHAHDWMTFPAALETAARHKKPLIVHIHSLETDRVGKHTRNQVYEIEKKAMMAADLIIAVSAYTRDQILAQYGIPPEKIFVVYNGSDPLAAPNLAQATKKVPMVLFLGRLTRQKGPTYLIEAAIQVLKKRPEVQFVVAGTGESLRSMMQYAQRRGVFRSFRFVGFSDSMQIAKLFAEADVYFMPSISEPFGLAALEAAQAALPVVMSAQSGLPEVLPGILKADYWDVVALSNYLLDMLTDPEQKAEAVKLNNEHLPYLTWARAAEDLCFYYQKLLYQG